MVLENPYETGWAWLGTFYDIKTLNAQRRPVISHMLMEKLVEFASYGCSAIY